MTTIPKGDWTTMQNFLGNPRFGEGDQPPVCNVDTGAGWCVLAEGHRPGHLPAPPQYPPGGVDRCGMQFTDGRTCILAATHPSDVGGCLPTPYSYSALRAVAA